MFTPEEILALVASKVEIAKPFIQSKGEARGLVGDKGGALPEYYNGYNRLVEDMEKIRIHSEKGVFPSSLFESRSPNQTDEEFNYIQENYKQTTLPVFIDYISSITRPFHRSNWSISYAEDAPQFEDLTLQEYLERGIKDYGSLEAFIMHVLPTLKTKDAEGVIAVKPAFIPVVINEEGEEFIDDMELIEPIPVYYSVKQVISQDDDHTLVELADKSPVTEGSRVMGAGLVYEFYDHVNIWRITQVGKRIDFKFQIELFFTHNWDRVPVTKLLGVPTVMDNKITYQSPFLYSTDNLDLVALNQSNLQASINKCVYPVRVMVGDICDFETDGNICDGGIISWYNNDGVHSSKGCPSCKGSGLKSRISPLGELLLKPESREGVGDTTIGNPLEYKSPEVTTLEFLRKEIAEHERRARAILHLNVTGDIAQGQQDATATAKAIDLKALAAFVNTISDQMFTIYEFVIDATGFMRYGDDYNRPRIQKPTTFDYTTEEDYVAQIAQMSEAGVPPMIMHQVVVKYLQTIYFTDSETTKAFNLIIGTDRLLGLSSEDIKLKAARGTINNWEDVLHCSATSLVMELESSNPNFFEQDFNVQKEQLIQLSKDKATVTTTEAILTESIVNGN
jgi:hypothetical protein